jgi:polar amino acid transport system substrate-binding protein
VKKLWTVVSLLLILAVCAGIAAGCGGGGPYTDISQLDGKTFAVPKGTVADKLVQSKLPKAKFIYVDTALAASQAVTDGKADAAAYDQPILKNIAAKSQGLTVLPQMITTDDYGFAVALGNTDLRGTIDDVVQELKSAGTYDAMLKRWLPDQGQPAAMPQIALDGANGTLKFGTASITEPFSYQDANKNVVGFDIELATYVAQKLGKKLEVIDMPFGDLLTAVQSGTVDMAGACITITADRSKIVLFSAPYYQGGIAALVKK